MLFKGPYYLHLLCCDSKTHMQKTMVSCGFCLQVTDSADSLKDLTTKHNPLLMVQVRCSGAGVRLTSSFIICSLTEVKNRLLSYLQCSLSPSSARRLSCWSTWRRRGSTSARWSRRPSRRTTTSSSTPRKSLSRRWRPTRRTGRPCWPPCWRGCRRRYCPDDRL